jgi:hypothetical protein
MKTSKFVKAGIFLALCATASLSLAQLPKPSPQGRTNGPPSVRIVTPGDGQAFLLGHKINICALSQNFTDAVARVEFFANTSSLGAVTNSPIVGRGGLPCVLRGEYSCLSWTNAAAGAYTLKAEATDLAGITVTSAPVDITVVTDLPPVVRIVKPRDGALILGPTNLDLCASAFDPDGTVASVEFFQGTSSLGVVTSAPPVWVTNVHGVFPIRQPSYCLTWSNVVPGAYSLTAVATDNLGISTTSAATDITVVTNLPPCVKLVHPFNGARFYAPADITLCAAAKDSDGTVTGVEFFEGSKSLGVVSSGITVTNHGQEVQTLYCLTRSNAPAATYTFTAVATDSGGATRTSAPITVSVVTPPPPQVNIVYPANGAKFIAPANIRIATTTRYFTHPIATVQFLAGTTTLGVISNSSWPTFLWQNVQPGTYSLTAVATDTAGTTATSAPVAITVVTNRPPLRPPWGR